MNLRIITKNHAANSKKGSPLKINFRAAWTHESIPTAWELKWGWNSILKKFSKQELTKINRVRKN